MRSQMKDGGRRTKRRKGMDMTAVLLGLFSGLACCLGQRALAYTGDSRAVAIGVFALTMLLVCGVCFLGIRIGVIAALGPCPKCRKGERPSRNNARDEPATTKR